MKTRHINQFLAALLISCSFVPTARADDDTRKLIGGIAAGIVGLALEQASAQEQQQTTKVDDIQWNTSSPSKPKLQYDDRTAEIQLKLKKINLYSGKIDGLKGQETIAAIKSWERFNSDNADGEISEDEMARLDEIVSASSQDSQPTTIKKSKEQQKTTKASNVVKVPGAGSITFIDSSRDNKDELELLLYNRAAYEEQYEICKNFQDKYVTFNYRIDSSLSKNYKKYENASDTALSDIATCDDMNKKEIADLQEAINEEYADSDESKMARIRAGHTFIEGGEDSELVARCNLLSNSLAKDTARLSSKDFGLQCGN